MARAPHPKQAVVTVVTIAAMGVVLAARGHEPLRVVTFGALCACWTLVLHAGTSIRDRRLPLVVVDLGHIVGRRGATGFTVEREPMDGVVELAPAWKREIPVPYEPSWLWLAHPCDP